MKSFVLINSIPIFNIEFADNVENTIVSNGIKEEFIGISTVKIGKKEILCEHSESDIVKCSVVFEGVQYNDIPFKLIIDKKTKPFVTINKDSLINPNYYIPEKVIDIVEESIDSVVEYESPDDNVLDFMDELVKKNKLIEKLKQEALNYKLKQEQNKLIEEEKIINFFNKKIETALLEFNDNAKKLIKNYTSDIDATERQIRDQIKKQLKDFEEKILNPNSYEGNKLMLEAIKEFIFETDTQTGGTINKFKSKLLEDIREASEQQLKNHTRQIQRYAEMVSGGGSVAMQFAKGGTMEGNLNVTGQYLSGGKNLNEIFLTSETDSQQLIWDKDIKSLSITYGNTVSLSSLVPDNASGVDTGVRNLTSNWESTYTTLCSNSANFLSPEIISPKVGDTIIWNGTRWVNTSSSLISVRETDQAFLIDGFRTDIATLSVQANAGYLIEAHYIVQALGSGGGPYVNILCPEGTTGGGSRPFIDSTLFSVNNGTYYSISNDWLTFPSPPGDGIIIGRTQCYGAGSIKGFIRTGSNPGVVIMQIRGYIGNNAGTVFAGSFLKLDRYF
jgi:hypothetical protein